jgi:hypothetical protein
VSLTSDIPPLNLRLADFERAVFAVFFLAERFFDFLR